MKNWQEFEIDRTLRDYDYTRRAVYGMNRIIDSSEFDSMDADAIFRYISGEMEIVLFPDYLKRYIYEKADIDAPFKEVPEKMYAEIIIHSFEESEAPFSFSAAKTRKSLIVKRWLSNPSVKRETIILFGFGLRMPAEDVSEFLTKVLKEEDFNFSDYEETILWFCFKNGLRFVQYRKLMALYQEMTPEEYNEKAWESMSESPELFLTTKANLMTYLGLLKSKNLPEKRQQNAYEEFCRLYDRCCDIIAESRNREAVFIDGGELVKRSDITPSDIEKELCSGIPSGASGNLKSMAGSRFSELFEQKRMIRQRVVTALNKSRKVERFDLITLLFFIYAETVEPDWPAERYLQYIDGVNTILHKCGMADIYPVNPYEAFILMCLVTDYPLDVYAEIWGKSYT